MRSVGMVGLGLLGMAMAKRLLAAGYDLLGYDLAPPQRVELEQAGGQAAKSAYEVAEKCDVVVLSLPDANAVASVIAAIGPALRSGQLIIDTTTGEPLDSQSLGQALSQLGVQFLDATIAGSSAQVAEGQVIAMVGGNEAALPVARELLGCFAKEVFHLGSWGSGARMKLVVNLVLGLNRAVLAEGLSFAAALDLDASTVLEILRASPAYSKVMDTKGDKMLSGDFSPQARLSQHLKDVRLILATGERTGAPLPLSSVHRQLLERAEAFGYGEQDNSVIIRAFAKTNPAPIGDESRD